MSTMIKDRKYYRHKMEIPLIGISVTISLVIFFVLTYLGYYAIKKEEEKHWLFGIIFEGIDLTDIITNKLLKIGGYISILIIVLVILKMFFMFLVSHNKAYARDVHITEKQFGELLDAEKEYAEKLGITDIPELFVAKDKEVMTLKGAIVDHAQIIRIFSEEVTCTATEGYYAAKFSIAKKLAAIYMGYYNPALFVFTIFSNWIPILSHACNRVMTYTTDKIAAELVGKDVAMQSIMATEINMYMLPYVNSSDYMENTKKVAEEKLMIFANILSNIPIPAYRIDAIKNGKDGKLL